ncbi:MAG: hypothetical protein K8E66_07845, partial [Phycisphaerales bacterium]|nr:hypothetical protein [Phycisphaerales bacterium]
MIEALTGRRGDPVIRPACVQASAIVCYHCGLVSSVSARAISASCEHCRRSIDLHDISVKSAHWGGVLCT